MQLHTPKQRGRLDGTIPLRLRFAVASSSAAHTQQAQKLRPTKTDQKLVADDYDGKNGAAQANKLEHLLRTHKHVDLAEPDAALHKVLSGLPAHFTARYRVQDYLIQRWPHSCLSPVGPVKQRCQAPPAPSFLLDWWSRGESNP